MPAVQKRVTTARKRRRGKPRKRGKPTLIRAKRGRPKGSRQAVKLRRDELRRIGSQIPPLPSGLPKPQLSSQSLHVLKRRYLKRNEKKEVVEKPKELFWRVAYNVATPERSWNKNGKKAHLDQAKKFYKILASQQFLPNSPTLMNAGLDLQQLSACFVLPVEDSMHSIFDALKATALVHKSGGGTGFSFSHLRPNGDIVLSTKREATGPVGFMRVFNSATEEVKQGGTRRGANMGILRVDHPDILHFVLAKADYRNFNNFNLSVAVTNQFMEQVKKDEKFVEKDFSPEKHFRKIREVQEELFEARGEKNKEREAYAKAIRELYEDFSAKYEGEGYDLINPHRGEAWHRLNAAKVFKLICFSAWAGGDPGVIFLDRINKDNPTPHLGEIESTNPCGEQLLLPYESCNLGSINLAKMVEDGKISWTKLDRVTKLAVRFLDNVIDVNQYPLPEIEEMTLGNRKIGLGVMGFADALIKLGISYDSEEGIEIAERVMARINKEALAASRELALERGPFPNFTGSIYDNGEKEAQVRNATRTTIAPTGSISMIGDCSSGIEPLYAVAYKKNVVGGVSYGVNPLFEEIAKKRGFYSEALLEKVNQKGKVRGIKEVPEEVQKVFASAHGISAQWHIKMQAAFQRHTDNAVSKTINFAHNVSVEEGEKAYLFAFKTGCKGITVFRDRSRGEQILEAGMGKREEETRFVVKRPRPEVVSGRTHKIKTPVGTAFIHVTRDGRGNIFEVFVGVGKAGSDVSADAEAIGRLISLTLRIVPSASAPEMVDQIVDQLSGIGGRSSLGMGPNRVRSLADAVAKVLRTERRIEQGAKRELAGDGQVIEAGKQAMPTGRQVEEESQEIQLVLGADLCPDCGNNSLISEEGCMKCLLCGYSQC